MTSTNETNTNNNEPRGSSRPEAHLPADWEGQLAHFTGTESVYGLGPLFRNAVYTDGVHFLIEKAQCSWLVTDAMAWVVQKVPGSNYDDGFMTVELHPKDGGMADLIVTDGNGTTLYTQHYTAHTFPLTQGIKMYAVWGEFSRGPAWMLMLTSEY